MNAHRSLSLDSMTYLATVAVWVSSSLAMTLIIPCLLNIYISLSRQSLMVIVFAPMPVVLVKVTDKSNIFSLYVLNPTIWVVLQRWMEYLDVFIQCLSA